jgi:hypothetical protein
MSFPTAKRFEADRDRSFADFMALVDRAKAAGRLRADFVAEDMVMFLMANAGVLTATADAAPETSRRLVAYFPGQAPLEFHGIERCGGVVDGVLGGRSGEVAVEVDRRGQVLWRNVLDTIASGAPDVIMVVAAVCPRSCTRMRGSPASAMRLRNPSGEWTAQQRRRLVERQRPRPPRNQPPQAQAG